MLFILQQLQQQESSTLNFII